MDDLKSAIKELHQKFFQWQFERAQCAPSVDYPAWVSEGTCEMYMKMYYVPNVRDFEIFFRNLRSWGIIPRLEQVWDLIPLSFVIDWIVNISSLLERVDLSTDREMLRVLQVTYSRKFSLSCLVELSDLGFRDEIADITLYERDVSYALPRLTYSSLFGSAAPINIIDAASLLLQHKK